MACSYINPVNGGELTIGTKLREFYKLGNSKKDNDFLEKKVEFLYSDAFKEKFGDWTNENYHEGNDRMLGPGDIKLFPGKNFYVLDKNNEKYFLNNRRFEGLEIYPFLRNKIEVIKNEGATKIISYIFDKYKNDVDDITDVTNLKYNLKNEIKAFFKDQAVQKPSLQPAMEILEKFTDDFYEEVNEILNNLNLKYTGLEDATDENYQEDIKDKNELIKKSSVEINSKNNATGNIKVMLSLLPDIEQEAEFFVGYKLLPLSKVWNDLMPNLSGKVKGLDGNNQVANPFTDTIDKLEKLAIHKPYIKKIIDQFNNSNFNTKIQFIQSFTNYNKLVQDLLIIKGNNYSLVNPTESASKKSQILTDVGINFKSNFAPNDVFEKDSYDNVVNKYKAFRELYKDFVKVNKQLEVRSINDESKNLLLTQQNEIYSEVIDLFKSILTDIGFNINDSSIRYFLLDNGKHSQLLPSNVIDQLGSFIIGFDSFNKVIQDKGQLSLFNKKTGNYLNPFKGDYSSETSQSIFNDIATAIGIFNTDMSEDMFFAGDKMIYSYSVNSHLSDTVQLMNESKPDVEKLNTPINTNSLWLDLINSNIKKGVKTFTLHRNSSIQEGDTPVNNRDTITTSIYDAVNRSLYEVLKGSLSNQKPVYQTMSADKSTVLKLELDLFKTTNLIVSEGGDFEFNDSLITTFRNYFKDDLLANHLAHAEIMSKLNDETGIIDISDLKHFYHISPDKNVFDILDASGKSVSTEIDKNNFYDVQKLVKENNGYKYIFAGNVFKNFINTSLSPENMTADESLALYDKHNVAYKNIQLDLTDDQISLINSKITNSLTTLVKDNVQKLIDYKVFNPTTYNNLTFDADIYLNYIKKFPSPTGIYLSATTNLTADYTINNLIAQIEYTKLFNGSFSNHKNPVDYFKRATKNYIDGKSLTLGLTENDYKGKVTILNDSIKNSKYINQMGKVGKEYYKNINQADAQAYITPERWRFLLERTGNFSKDMEKIYDKITNDKILYGEELKDLSSKPIKGVYYSNTNNNPLYLKYSQGILIPSLVKGTPLEKLLKQMRSQSIDEAIFESGAKVGAQFNNEDITQQILNNDSYILNEIDIDNRFWKLQQDLPNKGFKQTLLGSQIQKVLLDNLKDDETYDITSEESVTGIELRSKINSILGEKSNRAINKVLDRFDIGSDFVIGNWSKFTKDIAKQLREEGISENVVNAVEKELSPYSIPQAKDKIMSTILSIITKASVKLKTHGASLIQTSNFGLDYNTAKSTGIYWVKDRDELAEPTKHKGSDGNVNIKAGQVFISGNLISHYLPDWRKYTSDELFGEEGLLPKEILTLVGYRIPNQAMSSNDALDVVGILPDSYIDTIIPYTGITTKTGSDFDIDKMFAILPVFEKKNGKVTYPKPEYNIPISELSNKKLDNMLYELYRGILLSPLSYDSLITPIDHPFIKDYITKDLGLTNDSFEDYQAIDPINQIEMKYEFIAGGFGIGQVANHLVDSIVNQPLDFKLGYNSGWGHTQPGTNLIDYRNEKGDVVDVSNTYRISDTLTAILNGFVDIAKDPFITKANWNTQTTNTGLFLIRLGENPKKVMSFLAQPALVEMVQETSAKEGITSKDKNSSNVINQLKSKYLTSFKTELNLSKEDWDRFKMELNNPQLEKLVVDGVVVTNKINSRTIKQLENNITDPQNDAQYYLDQYLTLDEYDNLKSTVKTFTKSVTSSKYGENGTSKSLIDYLVQVNKLNEVVDSKVLDGFTDKFYNQSKTELSSLGHYHNNSEVLLSKLINANPKIFITFQSFFTDVINRISSETSNFKKHLDNRDKGIIIEKAIYSMISSNFNNFKVSGKDDFLDLFTNHESIISLSERINDVRSDLMTTGSKNIFLDALEIKEDGNLTFIGINNLKLKPAEYENKLANAWKELLFSDKYSVLAEDLVKYSYLQSGFANNGNQIFKYIPNEFFVKNEFNKYINNISIEIEKGYLSSDEIVENIYRHNVNNPNIVPSFNKNKDFIKQDNKLVGVIIDSTSNKHVDMKDGIRIFPNFISYNNELFKLHGYLSKENKYNNDPIYFKTFKLGYKSKKGQFHEYSLDEINESYYKDNNPSQDEVDKINDTVKDINGNESININLAEEYEIDYNSYSPVNFKLSLKIDEIIEPTVGINEDDINEDNLPDCIK